MDDLGEDFIKYAINGEEIPFHKKVPQVMCNTTKLLECIKAGNYTFDRDRFKILFNPELVVLLNEYDNIKNVIKTNNW